MAADVVMVDEGMEELSSDEDEEAFSDEEAEVEESYMEGYGEDMDVE